MIVSPAQVDQANTRTLQMSSENSHLSDTQLTYLLLSNSVKGLQLSFLDTLLQDICCVNFYTMLCLCKKQAPNNSVPIAKSMIQVYTWQNTYKTNPWVNRVICDKPNIKEWFRIQFLKQSSLLSDTRWSSSKQNNCHKSTVQPNWVWSRLQYLTTFLQQQLIPCNKYASCGLKTETWSPVEIFLMSSVNISK